MRLAYSDRALDDLDAIHAYIAHDSRGSADRLLARIDTACNRLSAFPRIGRVGARRGTRELTTVWPYLIVYRVLADRISIERIIHGARRR